MKKLSKRNDLANNTIEAYACSCSCGGCSCECTCSCSSSTGFSYNYGNRIGSNASGKGGSRQSGHHSVEVSY